MADPRLRVVTTPSRLVLILTSASGSSRILELDRASRAEALGDALRERDGAFSEAEVALLLLLLLLRLLLLLLRLLLLPLASALRLLLLRLLLLLLLQRRVLRREAEARAREVC